MRLMDTIYIRGKEGKRIELHQGDLTMLRPDEAVDLLVVSAFPNDYIPTNTSLIGALYKKGLSVAILAQLKDKDLRKDFSCWLSQEINPSNPGLQFRRILCFEPMSRGEPPELVGDIFRAMTPIIGEESEISSIAMPIVAAGDQGYSISTMLVPLLEAAIQWMERGLPLDCIKIVAHTEEQGREAIKVFSQRKNLYEQSQSISQVRIEYDVFISYARDNDKEMEILEKELIRLHPNIRIFLDRKDIDIGSPWQPQIFESLDKCRKVVVFFSPDYLKSKVCKEEFNIAWIRCRETDQEILFPLYLYSANLPTYMKYRCYLDCREGDETKLRTASSELLAALGPQ
ncbi:toll/interleukin-1 receptor domain-containing protein [Candidatus Methanocrinis natronophilus]|uniref:Toll/interleukin-1 receptor domain-containing protein n=1 Tax=Candidatus Methanocrinis natronophilus TaxID=3033396 RepID=A0ABT5X4V0_9EURY|nr:toll/interleukin-1 receptor domain-containing protein [Candidatus Methanocrinis natronophilus]MDF0589728.1 toll/interleukin-1 receptor domain-containing protein [Candidatus Methanocrinis natronophilus]